MQADLDDNWFGGTFTNADAALEHVHDKLASLDRIEQALDQPGQRQLLLLDLTGERAEAAVAVGDVDTADHVAVFTPGLGSTVDGDLERYDQNMNQLQRHDAVFFGSSGDRHLAIEDIQITEGRTYRLGARNDFVADAGLFGIDPTYLDGLTGLSAREETLPDGRAPRRVDRAQRLPDAGLDEPVQHERRGRRLARPPGCRGRSRSGWHRLVAGPGNVLGPLRPDRDTTLTVWR